MMLVRRCLGSSVILHWIPEGRPRHSRDHRQRCRRAGSLKMFALRQASLNQVGKILVDSDYTGKLFAKAVHQLLRASVEVVRRHDLHTFVALPKRCVVERSFAWLEKCRRLLKNCDRKLNTSLQMMALAFVALILTR